MVDKFLDKFEERLMRLAGKGYLCVGIASFVYLLWRGSWGIKMAAILVVVCFFVYSVLDPEPDSYDDDRDS